MANPAAEELPGAAQHGFVVSFFPDKGYGFIRPKNGHEPAENVFVHISNVEGGRGLTPGQNVTYYLTQTGKGLAAVRVRPASILTIPALKYAVSGFAGAALLFVLLDLAAGSDASPAALFGLWLVAASVISFFAYGYDKHQSERGRERVPKRVLHAFSIGGGAAGSLAGMARFHHKTSKEDFKIISWLSLIAQISVLLILALNS